MLIAVISDTHLPRGARRLPDACLRRLAEADLILHAGDITGMAALSELQSLGPVAAVRGNVDSPEVCACLPETRIVEAQGVRIAMVHDAGLVRGRLERLRRRFPDVDAVVFGHTHLPLHERSGSFHIFNPGSPTERRRAPTRAMGMARVAGGKLSFELVTIPG